MNLPQRVCYCRSHSASDGKPLVLFQISERKLFFSGETVGAGPHGVFVCYSRRPFQASAVEASVVACAVMMRCVMGS